MQRSFIAKTDPLAGPRRGLDDEDTYPGGHRADCPSIVVIVAGLNYTGLCVRKWSYPSDAQALESALRHQARDMEELTDSPSREELKQYLAANLDCCAILGYVNISDDMFIDYITGFRKKWVRILYKSRSASEPRFRDTDVAVFPCGDVGDVWPTRISEDQMKTRLQEIGQNNRRVR